MGRSVTPQAVAVPIALLARGKAAAINGRAIVTDGGNTIQDYKGPGARYQIVQFFLTCMRAPL
jgi:3-oxoacyl-[acyl-carrier protein] reductase